MTVLVYAEHDNASLKSETAKMVHAAAKMGGDIHVLVAGEGCQAVADSAAQIDGVSKVLLIDNAVYKYQLAENVADLVLSLADDYSHLSGRYYNRQELHASCCCTFRCCSNF